VSNPPVPPTRIAKWVVLVLAGLLFIHSLSQPEAYAWRWVGGACFLAIVARICQAEEHHLSK
jgi:predicted branched-subunit amino acid permease